MARLTKKQAIIKAIASYELALTKHKKSNVGVFYKYLEDNNLHKGLCYLFSIHLDFKGSYKWIDKYLPYNSIYICSPAYFYWNNKKIIIEKSIKPRLEVLYEELKKCK